MENQKLINAKKLKKIFEDVFAVFERNKLTPGEIEFVVHDLNKIQRMGAPIRFGTRTIGKDL